MSVFEKTLKLKDVHKIIKNNIIGTPKEIAEKLEISRSCLYNYIEDLKSIGAEIEYNRTAQYFYYGNNFDLKIVIEKCLLNDLEMKETKGGNFINFFLPSILLDGNKLHLPPQLN